MPRSVRISRSASAKAFSSCQSFSPRLAIRFDGRTERRRPATEYTRGEYTMGCYTMRSIVFLLWSVGLLAETPKYSASANFAADLAGEPDTRPGTWGNAGVAVWTIQFSLPAGYRVHVLRVYGDFLIWPRGHVQDGTYSGALFGQLTSSGEGSRFADLM